MISFAGIGGSFGGSASGSLGTNLGIGFTSNGGDSGRQFGLNLFGQHSASVAGNGHFNLGHFSGGYHFPVIGNSYPGFSGQGLVPQNPGGVGNGSPGFGRNNPKSSEEQYSTKTEESREQDRSSEETRELFLSSEESQEQDHNSDEKLFLSRENSREIDLAPQEPGDYEFPRTEGLSLESAETEAETGGVGIINPRSEKKDESKRERFFEKLRKWFG